MLRRSGFSLIEALVVLAIGGMALAIIFSIGTKAGDTGFKIGRGAMAAADADVAVSDLRTILGSFVLRPPGTFLADVDEPIAGEESRLTGDVVMRRANICGPQGWAGRLTLVVEAFEGGQQLLCEAGGQRATLLTMARGSGRFSYSNDGADWRSTFSNDPADFDTPAEVTQLQLFVRFEGEVDGIDVVQGLSSGPAERWIRNIGQL
ncbi:prepilin-type N-terminal cleavage/methylation domain-containing protein [Brevundimonas sp.]|uniref:prepilin-type N-terminal cleavage/methylation domain-containing protein n=1 Tax=Brevundimonas sp. TaxID=1871086 RepID=UPI00286BAC8D|nr:prepilin-type N-terminal cleavage/methylation domain-containing protein [Brevundimonas sp.]